MLLELRAAGELTCSQICEKFPQSQPTISHHIKTLAEAGLVKCRKEGQFHVISVDEVVLASFAADIGAELAGNGQAGGGARKRAGAAARN